MKIEIDASFHIANQHSSKFDELQHMFKVQRWPNQPSISIELIEDSQSENIDEAINVFFDALDQCDSIRGVEGSLRVAVYFFPNEVAAFSVTLSRRVIYQLQKYEMDIEVTGYPCSD
jgi:hypothetical protein